MFQVDSETDDLVILSGGPHDVNNFVMWLTLEAHNRRKTVQATFDGVKLTAPEHTHPLLLLGYLNGYNARRLEEAQQTSV